MPPSEPRKPRRPGARLGSLKDPNRARQQRRQPAQPSTRSSCPNDSCTDPQIESTGESLVCVSCGTVIEDSMIQAEVSFGETSAGAAVVQGGFVAEGQRYAKSMGAAFRRVGGTESREVTENQGREEIHKQGNALHLTEQLKEMANRVYKLCTVHNFIQGRRIRVVAAVCLYVASRQSKDNNTILLVDLAENIEVSIYLLGETYSQMKRFVFIKNEDFDNSREYDSIRPVNVEKYIERFVRRLDFGSAWIKVTDDACRILRRMDRDWMVTGRAPAGLCGACIILAARMNNFRRTVREVVYVVRVCDITIFKRLEEFKRTRASDLSVNQFREFGNRLKDNALPPAVYEAQEKEERKKRKLKEMVGEERDETEEAAARERSKSPTATATPAPDTQDNDHASDGEDPVPRLDADGFAIPQIPASVSTPPPKRGRGRPPKSGNKAKKAKKPIPEVTPEELEQEEAINTQIREVLNTWSVEELEQSFKRSEPVSQEIGRYQREMDRKKAEDKQVPGWDNESRITSVSSAVDIGEDEFADDPEVAMCLLTPAEQEVKERIWVTHNHDWLRTQQDKVLKRGIDEALGKTTGGSRAKRGRKSKQGDKEDNRPAPRSAGEANARMNEGMRRRPYGYTKGINFENLDKIWGRFDRSRTGTESAESRAASVAPSRESSVTPGEQQPTEPQQLPTPDPTQETAAPEKEPAQPGEAENREEAEPAADQEQASAAATEPPADAGAQEAEDYDDDEEDDDDDDDDDDDGQGAAALRSLGIEENYYDEDEEMGFDEDEGDDY